MNLNKLNSIIVFGAGAIGCFLAGHWQDHGLPVTLFAKPERERELKKSGLNMTGGESVSVSGEALQVSSDPGILENAVLVVISVKYNDLKEASEFIKRNTRPDTKILCLLNGIRPLDELRQVFSADRVFGGMVPFNVVWKGQGNLHRSSAGTLMVENTPMMAYLSASVYSSGAAIQLCDSIKPVQYGKLLLNLNNAVNALSGKTLYGQLTKKKFRTIYAATLAEALAVYRAAGISFEKVGPIPPKMVVKLLRSPNFIFNPLVTRIQKIDQDSKTSMASDLELGKKTEIEILNGEIVDIANRADVPAPINSNLVHLVHEAENGGRRNFDADELARQLGI